MGYGDEIGRFANHWSKSSSLSFVTVVYLISIGVAALVAWGVENHVAGIEKIGELPLFLAAVSDLVATILVWFSSIFVNNSSMYDPYWSLFTPIIIWYWYIAREADADVPTVRLVLVAISSSVWAIRLTSNWARDWPGLHHEDFRYQRISKTFQDANFPKFVYWIVGSFGAIHFFPTVQVFLGSIPLYFAVSKGVNSNQVNDLNALDFIATFVAVSAAILQLVADDQMRKFRQQQNPPGSVMDKGLWGYSRHPNYLGEILFWVGLFLHALAVDAASFWWSGVGVVSMTLMFVFASIPLMETRMLNGPRAENFRDTMDRIPMLVPFLHCKRSSKREQAQVSLMT